VSPSAISQQVGVLRDSGLVISERAGRSVLHLTTERGLALLDPEKPHRCCCSTPSSAVTTFPAIVHCAERPPAVDCR
jgi:hypothetical protein